MYKVYNNMSSCRPICEVPCPADDFVWNHKFINGSVFNKNGDICGVPTDGELSFIQENPDDKAKCFVDCAFVQDYNTEPKHGATKGEKNLAREQKNKKRRARRSS